MTSSDHCPGSRAQPIPQEMECSACGKAVEIWTDESKARCHGCGANIYREKETV